MITKKIINQFLLYLIVTLAALLLAVPLFMLISYSLRDNSEIITLNVSMLPRHLTLNAYLNSFTRSLMGIQFIHWVFNSFLVSGIPTVAATYIAAMAGYGFIRYRFRGKQFFFFAIFFTQIMPWIVLLVPYYSLLVKTSMLDNLFSLGFSYLIIYVPVCTWLFIGFFKEQPKSLEEAAKIDGCSVFGIFNRIIIPLTIPGLSAIALFSFIIGWGDFLFSSVIVKSAENLTLPLALQSYKGEHNILWAEIMAMATIITIPIVLLFLFIQKYLVNLLAGSIKE